MKVNYLQASIYAMSALLVFACTASNTDEDLKTLHAYQKQEEVAHLTNNANLLVEMFTDTLMQVGKGKVRYIPKDQVRERFTRYFGSVRFIMWANTAPPKISITQDGVMATVLVQKRVELQEINDSTQKVQKTDFAWLELWRKEGGQWRMYGNISTEKEVE